MVNSRFLNPLIRYRNNLSSDQTPKQIQKLPNDEEGKKKSTFKYTILPNKNGDVSRDLAGNHSAKIPHPRPRHLACSLSVQAEPECQDVIV